MFAENAPILVLVKDNALYRISTNPDPLLL